jgi:hypothetical protein
MRCADAPDKRNQLCEQDQGNSLVKLFGLRRSGSLPATVGQEEEPTNTRTLGLFSLALDFFETQLESRKSLLTHKLARSLSPPMA